MAEYVVAQAAVLIVPTTKGFQKTLEAELRKIQTAINAKGGVEVDITADTTKALGQFKAAKAYMESQDITLQAKVDTRTLTEIRHKYEDLAREMKKGLTLNLKVAGLSLLPQLASGLAAVNASMVQLVQAATLLPGALSAAAASIGTIVTGLSGVKAAFKEYSDAQKNAASEGQKARNAAINVQNAYRDLGRSVKDAQRNLEDLNNELRGAPLDEADAIIRVQEAIAEANDKAGKSGLQQQKDTLALLRAENDLVNVRLRNSRLVQDVADANAKGVAGADSVREATDRLSKAQDDASTKATKLSDSLAQLSPNAQAFIKAVTGMQSQWTAFKNATQDRLFAGLDQEVTQLAQNGLPTLQRGLGQIADALNGNVKTAFSVLQSPANMGFLDKILSDTAVSQERLSGVFDPLIDSFLRLSAAGTSFMPQLIDGLVELTTRFDNFIVRAEGDGSLDKWITQGIEEFKALGNSIINIGSILNSLTEAFTGSGGQTFLQFLEDGTAKLSALLKSDKGQARLQQFFITIREELAQWKPVLDQLPSIFANLSASGQAWANAFLPFLRTAARLLGEHPALVQTIFTAYMAWNGILPLLKGMKAGFDGLNKGIGYLNDTVMAGATGFTGRYATSVGFAGSKIESLTKAIISPSGLLAGATLAATFLTTKMVSSHDEAAAAAQRQKNDLDALTSSLDNVTGAATKATNAMVGKNILSGTNEATGLSNGNLVPFIKNGTPEQLNKNIIAGNLDAALAMAPGAADAKAVEATKWWDESGTALQKAGIDSQMVADALNGQPAAKAKFDEWQLNQMRSNAPLGFGGASKATLQGFENAGLQIPVNDLLDLQKQIPQSMQGPTALRQEIYSNLYSVRSAQDQARQQNQFFGNYTLKPNSPFSALGVINDPQVNQNGGGLTTRSKPPAGSQLEDQLRQDGVTFTDSGNGSYNVSLSQEAIDKYLDKYAAGGLISGPGTGTSDSILARLSHGEYVVNAKATQQHLPMLEKINGGGVPGYAIGGLIDINPFIQQSGVSAPPPMVPRGYQAPRPSWPTVKPEPYVDSGGMLQNVTTVLPEYGGISPDNASSAAMFNYGLGTGIQAGFNLGYSPAPKSPVAPKPVSPSGPVGTTIDKSTDSRVNPNTTVHSGSKSPAGPGGGLPQMNSSSAISAPASIAPTALSSPLPSLSGLNSDMLSSYGGLPVGTAINYGQAGFPDWVYQVGNEFGMLPSTYAGHQEGGGTNKGIDWAPNGVSGNTPEGADAMTKYAKYLASLGIMEQVIYQNPFTGETVGVFNGKPVGPGTDVPEYYRNDWAGHQNHIHTRMSKAIPSPSLLSQLGISSPSNMAMAMTPGGVPLPQLTFGQGQSGTSGASGSSQGGIRMPTPEEYAKYVSDSWMGTLENLVKNAGSIAMNFLGSFFGIDLSKITGLANSVMGGIDLPGMNGSGSGSGSSSTSNLPANADVGSILGMISGSGGSSGGSSSPLGQLSGILGGGSAYASGKMQFDPKGGAEQWRPVVRKALTEVGPKYGITNIKAWEDAIVRQIQTESNGNPNVNNLNDSNGRGGTQAVYGLGQFLPETFAKHNITGGSLTDPVAQIYAMIDYVATKYGMDASGAPKQIGRGVGYATGGRIKGAGSGRSDSIIARVSNGEYLVKAPMAQKHLGLLNAINANKLPGFADGMFWPITAPAPVAPPPPPSPPPATPGPPPPAPPPVSAPEPPPAPVPPDPMGPQADAAAGVPSTPAPTDGTVDPAQQAMQDVGAALGGIGDMVSGVSDGAAAPSGADPAGDPRAVLGVRPTNLDHNAPGVSKGIQAAGSAISGAISTAMQAAGGAMGGPGGAAAAGSASGVISGVVSAAAGAVSGAVNILSSLGVGTVTPGNSTAGAYGTALLPKDSGQQPYQGPKVVNNWNGGVHTSNNEEFYRIQQRRELQNAAPMLPQR